MCLGMGYCSYDRMESSDNRGVFEWPETVVQELKVELNCTAGPQIQSNEDTARATRRCSQNNNWDEYDGKQCATLDTARLRTLAKVTEISCYFF